MTLTALLSHIRESDRQAACAIAGSLWPHARWFHDGHLVFLRWQLKKYRRDYGKLLG